MQAVQSYVREFIAKELAMALADNDDRIKITPKRFLATKVSDSGNAYLSIKEGQNTVLSGNLMSQRYPGLGRVFFYPDSFIGIHGERYIEVKGYGADGKELCLWLHRDGDILFGMFYHNAKKEYKILEESSKAGLKVPLPLMLGKIEREDWLDSGLRVAVGLSREDITFQDLKKLNLTDLEKKLQKLLAPYPVSKKPLEAFNQPYNAGFLIRAPISPFRLGDPSDKYLISEENINIARQCGDTFSKLLDLGYFHLSPGTGNWTTVGELTDMADCYDLRKDQNLERIILKREKKTKKDFFEDLLGQRHTGNLSPFFIEGVFGESLNLKEAGKRLRSKLPREI